PKLVIMTADVGRPKRASATVLDMVRSLGLMAVIVAVTLIFVPNLLHPSKSDRVQPYDYSDVVAGFHQVTGLTALTPTGVLSGWYANSARLTHRGTTATLYIGWVSPTKKYAALYESNQASIAIDTSAAKDRSVRRTIGKLTIVITGSASTAELNQLAASLGG
ncbi:MAG: DUF4245 family protein, partial [Mycobacteriales bacterium]